MTKAIICFVCVLLFKFTSNFLKYLRCKALAKEHRLWACESKNDFLYHKGEARDLLKRANVKDTYIPISQPTGYGQIRNINAPLFENIESQVFDIASKVSSKFDEAIGTYKLRAFESFNPIYWIETIVFLPKSLLQYIGMDMDKPATRLCNVLLTVIWWIIGATFMFFRPQIYEFIRTCIG